MLKTERGGYEPHPGFLFSKCVLRTCLAWTQSSTPACAAHWARPVAPLEVRASQTVKSLTAFSRSITLLPFVSSARHAPSGLDDFDSLRSQARFAEKHLNRRR